MEEHFRDLHIDPTSAQACPNATCNASCPVHCPRDDMTTRRRRLLPSIPYQPPPVSPHLHKRLLPQIDEAERERKIAQWQASLAQGSSRRDNWLQQKSNSESLAKKFHVAVDVTTTDDSSSEFDRYKEEARAARRIQKTKKRYSGGGNKKGQAPK